MDTNYIIDFIFNNLWSIALIIGILLKYNNEKVTTNNKFLLGGLFIFSIFIGYSGSMDRIENYELEIKCLQENIGNNEKYDVVKDCSGR